MNEIAIKSQNIKATQYGIEFTGKPSIKEWYQAVQAVQKINGLCQWYLGDLIVYAESPVTGWGESKYDDLMEATGYDYETLRNYANTARRFNHAFREEIIKRVDSNPHVSFAHFRLVAPLEDERAIYFLGMVRDGGWSVAKLREEIVRFKNKGSLPTPKEERLEGLPDGWVDLKQSHITGYVPAPEAVGKKQETYLIEFAEWELRRLRDDYSDDPKMLSLCHRIDTALGEQVDIRVIDAYVINIMPQQITRRIKCLPTDTKAIQQERDNFKVFLVSSFELGRFFFSQLDAWMVYNFQAETELLFEESESSSLADSETSWMNDIEEALRRKIKPTNYNEFMGQE